MPHAFQFHGIVDRTEGFGMDLKKECRRLFGSFICLCGLGEMLANKDTYCEIDPDVVDRFGIPVLRFHFKRYENGIKMARHMQTTLREIVEASGGEYLDDIMQISAGGEYFHELGTVRMGASPDTSAVNSFCQAHDVRNLYVADGACFVSSPEKLPTLTIMALAWRAAEDLVARL